ncbi:MAG: RraA family protein [Betaproteobacteria bacterium]|jgi:regulator of RNase E activity RraA|nr:MAG: RraA family protein [Betaproteobacteria bacterium]
MHFQELFTHLREFDTPTICNALEIASGLRELSTFTQHTLIAASSRLPAIVGFARTAKIRCSTPYDPAQRSQNRVSYYEYIAGGEQPSIAVIEDVDELPGVGAFWGEVNTHIHRGLGCVGTVTNGSMRDLGAMHPDFQCLAGSLSPSHAWVQVVEIGAPVEIFGMRVNPDEIIHADGHGAVVIPPKYLEKLPAAIDLMARREKVLLDAAKRDGFDIATLKEAMSESEKVR